MDEEYELTLEQLGAAETAVDKLAELLREWYHNAKDPEDRFGSDDMAGEIEDLFSELELDL